MARPTMAYLTKLIGLLGMAIALAAESVSALAVFDHRASWAALVHVGAALIWLAARLTARQGRIPTPANFLSTETGVEFCLIVILFPGLGMLAAAAGLASNFLFATEVRTEKDFDQGEADMNDILASVESTLSDPFDPLAEMDVQPLAARLATATVPEKRLAIDLICRCPHPNGLLFIRRLLADRDPDVRALAAVAMDRLATRERMPARKDQPAQEALDS